MKNQPSLSFIIISFFFIVFFTSCSLHIEKRHYRKGYYVEMNAHKKTRPIPAEIKNTPLKTENKETVTSNDSVHIVLKDSLVQLTTPTYHHSKTKKQSPKTHQSLIQKNYDDLCDVIIFTDGTQLEVVIEELGETDIKYKKCSFKDGPSYRVSKSKIKKINLKNGEVYEPQSVSNNPSNGQPNGATIASLVLGIIALICLIIGIVLVFSTGAGLSGLIAAVALAPAGILSLIGLVMASTQLKKGGHKLALVSFLINLIVQILAIVFTILMFLV